MDWNWTAFIAMFLLFISADRVAAAEETPMAFKVLQQFDFPIGHLPKGTTRTEQLDGEFQGVFGRRDVKLLAGGLVRPQIQSKLWCFSYLRFFVCGNQPPPSIFPKGIYYRKCQIDERSCHDSLLAVRTTLSEWYLAERVSKQSFRHLVPMVPQVPPALMRNPGRFSSSYDLEEAIRGYDAFPLMEVGD